MSSHNFLDVFSSLLRRATNGVNHQRHNIEPFQYQPLNAHREELRLLGILPDSNQDSPISCVLSTISLRDKPRYTALSYCWGGPSSPQQILLSGSTLQVTSNLATALRTIRSLFASESLSNDLPRLFWIDAICINQQDIMERESQVRLMRNIYASATNVLSWLGHSDDSVLSAFEFMAGVVRTAHNPMRSSNRRIQDPDDGSATNGFSFEPESAVETSIDPRLLYLLSLSESVIDFFSLDYWHRIWIVQEIVVTNPRDNILMFGGRWISFQDVQVFRDSWLNFLKEIQLNNEWEVALSKSSNWEPVFKSKSWPQYLNRMEETLVVWSYYDFMRGVSSSGDSLFYVILANVYKAADPRDNVFALLGLVSQPRLAVDYQKPVADIYIEWFVTVLEDWQDLQPLYFSGGSDLSNVEVPSWVPDLSAERTDSPVWDATLAATIEEAPQNNFNFGVTGESTFSFGINQKVLHARGIRCGTVGDIHYMGKTNAADRMAEFCQLCLVDDKNRLDPSGIPILQVIFRVLMCGINRFASFETVETSLVSRDYPVTFGRSQLQLNRSIPLMQAVAKFLLSRGAMSLEPTEDVVLRELCKSSPPLGAKLMSDVQLAGAFIAFLLTGEHQTSSLHLLRQLGLPPGPNIIQAFLKCFFPKKIGELDHMITGDLFQNKEVRQLVRNIERYFDTFEHTFFFTSGGYLGNGPRSMATGDEVIIFEGAKMPFIVRRIGGGDQFRLVGPCYVEGLSDGEPAASARAGEVPCENISLV